MPLRPGPPLALLVGLVLGVSAHQLLKPPPEARVSDAPTERQPRPRTSLQPSRPPAPSRIGAEQPSPLEPSPPAALREERARYLTVNGRPPPPPTDPEAYGEQAAQDVIDALLDHAGGAPLALDCKPYPCIAMLVQHSDRNELVTPHMLAELGYPHAIVSLSAVRAPEQPPNTYRSVQVVLVDQPLSELERLHVSRRGHDLSRSNDYGPALEALDEVD